LEIEARPVAERVASRLMGGFGGSRRTIPLGKILVLWLATMAVPAWAQFDGPGSPGVSASLIRLFGTNFAFTAQAEYQLLNRSNQEVINLPMNFARSGNQLRVEIDLARMKNREQPGALAQVKPLGLDQIVTILRPEQRATWQVFPKLRAFVKLPMPATESDSFLKPAKMERSLLGKERLEGYACVKYRVVAYNEQGRRHEATVWNAPELRDFPVCVATVEEAGTVMMRFRQVRFVRPEAAKFEPPAGFVACADMQALMAGPATKYMAVNNTAVKTTKKPAAPATKAKSTSRPTKKK